MAEAAEAAEEVVALVQSAGLTMEAWRREMLSGTDQAHGGDIDHTGKRVWDCGVARAVGVLADPVGTCPRYTNSCSEVRPKMKMRDIPSVAEVARAYYFFTRFSFPLQAFAALFVRGHRVLELGCGLAPVSQVQP